MLAGTEGFGVQDQMTWITNGWRCEKSPFMHGNIFAQYDTDTGRILRERAEGGSTLSLKWRSEETHKTHSYQTRRINGLSAVCPFLSPPPTLQSNGQLRSPVTCPGFIDIELMKSNATLFRAAWYWGSRLMASTLTFFVRVVCLACIQHVQGTRHGTIQPNTFPNTL